ncbi:MAG TPA: DUF362 domain-containing protein [Acidisarcina sp.]|nr:DUF362 domain-containing protein [Acidisarcina sp.]
MGSDNMTNRRDFLRTAAVGAAVLGAEGKIALAKAAPDTGKSKVVLATDQDLRGQGALPDEQRVLKLLDRAMLAYGGHSADSWRRFVHSGEKVSIKVNTIAGKGMSTHVPLVLAICERLQQAGVKAGDIIIWDRTNHELERAGYTISTDPNRVRCFGTDMAGIGYEEVPENFGSVSVKLSKILTRNCDVMINVPLLKDHEGAGVTLAMKNMYGVVEKPNALHGGGCNPAVADLNMVSTIRQKMRLTVLDAMTGLYNGGPGFRPEYTWPHNSLLIAQDRVALDYTGWQIIEKKRAEKGLKTLADVGRPPAYISTAADAQHKLGTNDPRQISLMEA